jgi:hypothetical protein
MLGRLKDDLKNAARAFREGPPAVSDDAQRLADYAREHVVPRPPVDRDGQPWVPLSQVGHAGIDLQEAQQLALIEKWKAEAHQALIASLRNNPSINTQRLGGPTVANGWYNTPDAEIYASMILDRQPGQIVEVGAGFSTRVARAAIGHAGLQTRITIVDPEPRTDVASAADSLVVRPVEQSGLAERDWSPGDFLFIDSSHICRTRGDVPFLFCQVVPRLPPGVVVHVHDIYLPFDYPNNQDHLWYTEQYVLLALLAHSPRYRTVLTSHWLSRTHGDRMRAVLGPEVGRDTRHYGGCYWFEITDR